MDWMWEYYTYMSHVTKEKELAEAVEKIALAAKNVAEHFAALMRELGKLACTETAKRTRMPHRRQASMPLTHPWRARRLAMQQNRPPGAALG